MELFPGVQRIIRMDTHASTQSLLPLQEPPTDGRTFLNGSVWFVDSDGYRVVFRWHEPLYRVALTDEVHLRLVAVSLRQSQLATQEEICRAFGHDVSTQARWERQYRKHGIDGLVPKKRTGRPRELDKSQEGFVRRWFRAGVLEPPNGQADGSWRVHNPPHLAAHGTGAQAGAASVVVAARGRRHPRGCDCRKRKCPQPPR